MRKSAVRCLLCVVVAAGCSSSGTGAPSDAGSSSDASSAGSDAAPPDDTFALDGQASEAATPPPEAAAPIADAAADAADALPPFVDPLDGASGCPDGGYPVGRGACDAVFPLSGHPAVNGVFRPGACDNNNDGYASLWFASDYGYGQNTTNVRVIFTPSLAGMVGPVPVVVSVDVPDGDFARLSCSTPPGACTVTLASDVCWDFEEVQYFSAAGTGHCTAPAVSAGDAGGAITIGDFWFQGVSYP